MKILVTGSNGQLGYDVCKELQKRKIDYIPTDVNNMDITVEDFVRKVFEDNKPTHVIHCAAFTAVDKAEDEEALCTRINVLGTENLVNICRELDIPLMYFSTDYVFGGEGITPFKVDDETNPLGVYARTKHEGELLVKQLEKYFIVRISWAFGKNGNNFINTMMRLSESNNVLKVVNDQIGSPTYTTDLAKLVCDMIVTDKYGVYHASNEGYVSWADFAREIFKLTSRQVKVVDVSTEEYNAKAHRPKNSRLDKSKLVEQGFELLPTWQDALYRYLKEKSWLSNK